MQSDILILFPTTPSPTEMSQAKTCLMQIDKSVLVHQKETSSRLILVKFTPTRVSPAQLLARLRDAGFDVTMAGG